MTRAASTFKQSDIKRAIAAVSAAGIKVARVDLDPRTGRISVVSDEGGEKRSNLSNSWDEVLAERSSK